MIEIHPTAQVASVTDIEDSVKGTRVIIGARTVIDAFVKIKSVGGRGDLLIGEEVYINSGCVFYTGNGISIGNNVSIAANCTFSPVNHEYNDRSVLIQRQGFKKSRGGIVVEQDVWIGANCVLLDGTVLRRGCVVGAMSLVKGEVAEYEVVGGNPIRNIGRRQ